MLLRVSGRDGRLGTSVAVVGVEEEEGFEMGLVVLALVMLVAPIDAMSAQKRCQLVKARYALWHTCSASSFPRLRRRRRAHGLLPIAYCLLAHRGCQITKNKACVAGHAVTS